MRSTLTLAAAALALAVASTGSALAMGNDPPPSSSSSSAKPAGDPNYARARAMIEARDYRGAQPLLQQVVANNPRNADAYNLLGFATRKSGNPQGSLQYYTQALQIDPKHLGAHEYIGEAYLQLDRPQEAQQHLARLDSLCTFGCTEYRMLKAAIADYKAGRKPTN